MSGEQVCLKKESPRLPLRALSIFQRSSGNGETPGVPPRWLFTASLLVVILALAAMVRSVNLTDNPPGFFGDEASIGVDAFLLLTTGRDEHGAHFPIFFRSLGDYKLPIFVYGAIPLVAIWGLTEQAVRLTATVFGVLTVISIFLLTRALFNDKAALASAFLLSITPWHIHYSRTGFELISLPFVLTTGLFLFFMALRNQLLLPLAGVVFGLSFYTYRAAWLTVPLVLVGVMLLYRKEVLARPGTGSVEWG